MKAIGFGLFYLIAKPLSLLPLRVLYLLSDFLYLLVYKTFGYRKKVVLENLSNTFPSKTEDEINKIAAKFYRNFCDFVVENLKIMSMSDKEYFRRMRVKNPELLDELYKNKRNIVFVSGHTFNWEWVALVAKDAKHKLLAVYQPLQNKYFDRLFKKQRERFGCETITMKETFTKVYNCYRNQELFGAWLIADQSPPRNYPFWTKFLNQETAIYNGAERIAKTTNAVLLFLEMKKIKRGYYELEMVQLYDNPKATKANEITLGYTKHLEDKIKEDPTLWLWTHRRWKHKRQEQELVLRS